MKKLIYLFILGIGFTSCSVESIDSTENLVVADLKGKVQSVATITPSSGVLCAGEVLTFTLNVSTTKTTQVQQLDAYGIWQQVFKSNDGVPGSATFDIVLLEKDNLFRTVIAGDGQNDAGSFFGVNCNTCDNSLEVDLVCGEPNTLTVTFTAVEAGPIVIQGGLTNGTTISNASSNVLTRNLTHNSVQNSNANVTRWEGDVDACEVVTITIEFTGGNGIGDWSAKRGEEVLGSTAELECN